MALVRFIKKGFNLFNILIGIATLINRLKFDKLNNVKLNDLSRIILFGYDLCGV